MSDEEEINPDSVGLDDVKEMDDSQFRVWTFLKINEICRKVDKLDLRLWSILVGVILSILLMILRIVL